MAPHSAIFIHQSSKPNMPRLPRVFQFRQICFATVVLAATGAHTAQGQPAFFMGLGDLPGGAIGSRATDISGDGSVVVGWSVGASGTDAYRWTRETGMVGLGALTAFNKISISTDGSAIVGSVGAGNPPNIHPFRWTAETDLVTLAFGGFVGTALGVNGDGSVVVGSRRDTLYGEIKACVGRNLEELKNRLALWYTAWHRPCRTTAKPSSDGDRPHRKNSFGLPKRGSTTYHSLQTDHGPMSLAVYRYPAMEELWLALAM